jgi:hypothetical protein
MTESDSEKTVSYLSTDETPLVCPFTQSRGRKIGNGLIVLMFFIIPLLLFVYFALIGM